jgi:glycosyltransferase involved in cell wall biosynthesis
MKVAIVCDWLTGIGGAERVVLELHRMFPEAPIYTSQYDPEKIDWFKNADVRTGWLQNLSHGLKKFLPVLRAWTFSRLDLSNYDLIISSSGAEAKGIKTGSNTLHISYCHAPTHYYWSRYSEYIKQPGFGLFNPLARLGLKILVGPMRKWDYRAAQQPDVLIANSTYTQSKIKEYYGRDSTVIHPPVDTKRFQGVGAAQRRGFVIAGRQTPYKRIDLAVKAATKLGVHLTVIGNGSDHQKLRRLAGKHVTFLTDVSDQDIVEDFKAALAFIFPNIDDFGITAVEAMAAGTPVIAYNGGGARDYVRPGITGLFFDQQTVGSLAKTMQNFDHRKFDNAQIANYARRFSAPAFRINIANFIKSQHTKKIK